MADETIVLITGVGRGIGKALAEKYLLRPNHTVIGSVRDASAPKSQELEKLPTADGSSLLLVNIESTSTTDPKKAIKEIESKGINHLDIVIASAGICPTSQGPDTVEVDNIMDAFQVNAVAPVLLYQAVKPLLEKSSKPVWLTVSTVAGSIANHEAMGASIVTAYGMSKAAVNLFTVAIHSTNPKWIAFNMHPGLVQTDMGNKGAELMGMEEAPITLENMSSSTLSHIDNATRENTSGRFIYIIDGTDVPY